MRALSTRIRILGWYMLLLAAALAIGLFLQRSVLLAQINDEVNAQLQQEVEELEQLSEGRDPNTGQPFGGDVRAIFETFLRRNLPVEGEALFTLVDGQPFAATVAPAQLFEDEELLSRWASITTTTRAEADTEAGRVRYLAVPVHSPDGARGTFIVTFFLDEKRERVNDVLQVGALVYGSVFLIASAAAWFAAGRALRPVGLLTAAARSISDSSWSERIPVEGNDEMAELASTFNDMVDRLETAFETQRRFIDDAGHELRTPITIIRGHLELMSMNESEREESQRLVLDELDRMSRMVEDLLLLAKSEQPDFLDFHPVDVAELTEEVAAKAATLSDRHDFALEEAAPVVVDADRQRLTQALMNLAANAVTHTPPGTAIRIGSRCDGDAVSLWVSDNGYGIATEDQERIFQRFSRGASGRRSTDGAGLGLAIVKAIAEGHGGRVELQSLPGAGATFTIIMPAAANESPDTEVDE